jgi:hypothetical protein
MEKGFNHHIFTINIPKSNNVLSILETERNAMLELKDYVMKNNRIQAFEVDYAALDGEVVLELNEFFSKGETTFSWEQMDNGDKRLEIDSPYYCGVVLDGSYLVIGVDTGDFSVLSKSRFDMEYRSIEENELVKDASRLVYMAKHYITYKEKDHGEYKSFLTAISELHKYYMRLQSKTCWFKSQPVDSQIVYDVVMDIAVTALRMCKHIDTNNNIIF